MQNRLAPLWGGMTKLHTHYDNLKVSRDAPDFVIRAAYKTLTQKYHPDKNTDPDAARVMQVINRAYQVLSDPELRAEHDDWIRTQEAKDASPRPKSSRGDTGRGDERASPPQDPPRKTARRPVVFPQGGSASADSLPGRMLTVVADRSRDLCGDRTHVALGPTVGGTLYRAGISAGWLVFAYGLATDSRWSDDALWWIGGITAFAGIYFGAQAYKLYLLRARPFHPSLNITPLYVVETTWDRVTYWPIALVQDIRAVHHHRNGSHTHTSFDIDIAGTPHSYVTDSKFTYDRIVERLNEGRGRFLAAEQRGDQSLLDSVDELMGIHLRDPHQSSSRGYGFLVGWVGGCLAFLLAFSGLASINQELPARKAPTYAKAPASQPTYQSRSPVDAGLARQTKDHIAGRIGAANIPTGPAYIRGEPVTNTKGLSTVTVDNTKTSGDVLVKLVAIDGQRAWPVRTFFIPAGRKFTAKDVSPGTYEIRYMDRYSGDASKSGTFTLEETKKSDGIEYSNMTLTLYRVAGGNMRMQTIDPLEF